MIRDILAHLTVQQWAALAVALVTLPALLLGMVCDRRMARKERDFRPWGKPQRMARRIP